MKAVVRHMNAKESNTTQRRKTPLSYVQLSSITSTFYSDAHGCHRVTVSSREGFKPRGRLTQQWMNGGMKWRHLCQALKI